MDLISEYNLNSYLNDLADELKWDLANHKSIYHEKIFNAGQLCFFWI